MKEYKGPMLKWLDDPQLVTHRLNIKEGIRLVKQASRNFKLELEVKVKQKIQEIFDVGLIKPL